MISVLRTLQHYISLKKIPNFAVTTEELQKLLLPGDRYIFKINIVKPLPCKGFRLYRFW